MAIAGVCVHDFVCVIGPCRAITRWRLCPGEERPLSPHVLARQSDNLSCSASHSMRCVVFAFHFVEATILFAIERCEIVHESEEGKHVVQLRTTSVTAFCPT